MTSSPNRFSSIERRDRLRLSRTQNVGPVAFAELIRRFGTAAAALDAVPDIARRGGVSTSLRIPKIAEIECEISALEKLGGELIVSGDPAFPPSLQALDTPPPTIMILGRRDLLAREMIAIVGARNASALGRKFAQRIASDIGDAGLVIESGLARGIDTAAHEGSLATGTAAVVAGGIDVIYPPENRTLYDRIRAEGLVISEMPLGLTPQARHFPRRNRIISGLSRGVVIVEAAEGSGSLITANYALEQGREIFAVPGSPLDPRAKGTNRLIREGATLTESADDVLSGLQSILCEVSRAPILTPVSLEPAVLEGDTDRVRGIILELLGPSGVDGDELVRQSGVPAAFAVTAIMELELAGVVVRQSGNRIARCSGVALFRRSASAAAARKSSASWTCCLCRARFLQRAELCGGIGIGVVKSEVWSRRTVDHAVDLTSQTAPTRASISTHSCKYPTKCLIIASNILILHAFFGTGGNCDATKNRGFKGPS